MHIKKLDFQNNSAVVNVSSAVGRSMMPSTNTSQIGLMGQSNYPNSNFMSNESEIEPL